jgi:hypothetical protein
LRRRNAPKCAKAWQGREQPVARRAANWWRSTNSSRKKRPRASAPLPSSAELDADRAPAARLISRDLCLYLAGPPREYLPKLEAGSGLNLRLAKTLPGHIPRPAAPIIQPLPADRPSDRASSVVASNPSLDDLKPRPNKRNWPRSQPKTEHVCALTGLSYHRHRPACREAASL